MRCAFEYERGVRRDPSKAAGSSRTLVCVPFHEQSAKDTTALSQNARAALTHWHRTEQRIDFGIFPATAHSVKHNPALIQ